MLENRLATRLEEGIDVTVSLISRKKNLSKEKVMYNSIKDFSASGVSIQTNVLFPVGTLLNVKFTLKSLREKINAIGKVKWVSVIVEDKYYEMGVEFVNASTYALKRIDEYISWKKKNEKPKSALSILINKRLIQE
ncbi:MAG: PilZ domain-containing protein [Syntrophaceae bacterium]|nr:PilZ domain-containing protein [Syntrophaceae bacterium]